VILIALSQPSIAAEKLKLVNDVWAPYTSEELPGNGIATEIVVTALNKAGYETSVSFVPWARALKGTLSGTWDVLMTTSFTDERAQVVAYSEPYLENVIRFIKLKGKPHKFDRIDDLFSLQIGVVQGYAYEPDFDRSTLIVKSPNRLFANNLRMLLVGRLDLVVEDELVAHQEIKKNFPDEKGNFSFLSKALNKKSLHIVVRKKHPAHRAIIDHFNTALREMRRDGSYNKIRLRHGFPPEE